MLTIFYPKMVYLVGGYQLTRKQVLEWCHPRHLNPPVGNTTVFVNRWLRDNGITHTRLLACDYHQKPIFLVVTDRKVDGNGTSDNFQPFQESERAREIKKLLEVGEVEFITVPNPYGY